MVSILAAFGVSLFGTRLSHIAVPWLVLTTTGSVTKTGLVAACEMAPYVVVKALSGPVIDHIGPRRVTLVADAASAAAMAAVALAAAAGRLDLWLLCVGMAVVGGLRGPGDAAKEVFLPEVAERAKVSLDRMAGFSGIIERLAGTVGPAAGGVLVAWVGTTTTLVVTAAAFGAGALLVSPTAVGTAHRREEEPAPYVVRLRQGFDYLRGDRLLRSITGMVAVSNLLDAALFAVLLPAWALRSGHGPEVIGFLGSATGLCAVAGSLLATVIDDRLPRRLLYLVGFTIGGAPRFVVLALDVPLPVQVAVFGACGLGLGVVNPIIGAVVMRRVPRHLLGRVNTMGDAAAWSGIPLGGVVGGAAAALVGLSPVLLVAGGTYLIATTLPGLRPEWREMDARASAISVGTPSAGSPTHTGD